MRGMWLLPLIVFISFSAKARPRSCKFACPPDMVPVCSKEVNVCVDRFELYHPKSLKPLGYMNKYLCEEACAAQGKRLLKNREWRLACEGTEPQACNIYKESPVVRMYRAKEPWIYQGVDCKLGDNRWTLTCMNDPRLNELPDGLANPGHFQSCVSRFGVYDMVGNLGEWVDDESGTFNGGLYPMPRSSCQYTTTAHGPDYSDYSIGCRCGMTPVRKKDRRRQK